MASLDSPAVIEVIDNLRGLGKSEDPAYGARVRAREAELGGRLYGRERAEIGALAPQAVGPHAARILHGLVLAARPALIVEFGSSFGVSTIHLAAALSDLGAGRLIATELIPEKAAALSANLARAGLDGIVEVRCGDARETLADLPARVDMLFLDGSNDLYVEMLELLDAELTPAAVIVADLSRGDPHHDRYRAHVSDPDGDFLSVEIPVDAGLVVSTRRRGTAQGAAQSG